MRIWSAARTTVRRSSRKRPFATSITALEARKKLSSGIFSTRDSPGAVYSCGTIFAQWIIYRRARKLTQVALPVWDFQSVVGGPFFLQDSIRELKPRVWSDG